jgi:hypothetical protein
MDEKNFSEKVAISSQKALPYCQEALQRIFQIAV